MDQQESEFQTDTKKSKLTAELSSVDDRVPNRKRTVTKQQELVAHESKALEEALYKVRRAENRLGAQQEEEQQARDTLTQEQRGVNAVDG